MKYVIFGGFDYAVPYEMDQNAIFEGIDYFVDNDPALEGTTYLGKEIKNPNALLKENKKEILILIGSIINRTELSFQLKDMGFIEDKHFIWAISFTGDKKCPRLWKHIEWNDKSKNAENLYAAESGEYSLSRLRTAAKMIEFNKYTTLVDLGAANERLRNFIPRELHYVPVDYMRYSEQTVICNLNNYEFPLIKNDPKETCIVSIGNIVYCHDWKWYLNKISESCNCFILGHDDFPRVSREYRKRFWTRYNALFDHEIIRYMLELGFNLTDAVDFRLKTTCYKFEKPFE